MASVFDYPPGTFPKINTAPRRTASCDGSLINDLALFTAHGYLTSIGDRLGAGSGDPDGVWYRMNETWEEDI